MASAAEIKVLSTQATEEAYRELALQFEKASQHKVTTIFTGTLGVMKRLADGEAYDLLIMSSQSIDELTHSGKVVAGSRVNLAKSGIGAAVSKGAPKPTSAPSMHCTRHCWKPIRSAIPPVRAAFMW